MGMTYNRHKWQLEGRMLRFTSLGQCNDGCNMDWKVLTWIFLALPLVDDASMTA